jgi:hypothetical protein
LAAKEAAKMTIRKAMVIINYDGRHEIHEVDVVEYQGEFWLVPEWLDNSVQKITKPTRLVSLAHLPHQRVSGRQEFVVHDPVPSYVLFGRIPPETKGRYAVIEFPDLSFPIQPRGLH